MVAAEVWGGVHLVLAQENIPGATQVVLWTCAMVGPFYTRSPSMRCFFPSRGAYPALPVTLLPQDTVPRQREWSHSSYMGTELGETLSPLSQVVRCQLVKQRAGCLQRIKDGINAVCRNALY